MRGRISLHRITSGWIAVWFNPGAESMKKCSVKVELWRPKEMVMTNVMRNRKAGKAAMAANQAIDYARFRSRLCDGVKK